MMPSKTAYAAERLRRMERAQKAQCAWPRGVAAPAQATPVLYEGRIFFSIGQTTVAIDATNCNEVPLLSQSGWEA